MKARFIIIIIFGLAPAIVAQFFTTKPTDRYIHIRSFRYGKDPSVIRCSRGDRLHLTFSTDDTGHSFFLEEFDMDAKVSPARDEVAIYKTSDPTKRPLLTREYTFTAKHAGWMNYLVSKSNFRCHVWCGPMHAFEQGKLILLPNTLLIFSLGCLAGLFLIWISGIYKPVIQKSRPDDLNKRYNLLEKKDGFIEKLVTSRGLQISLTLLAMVMIYIVILTAAFGTKMSGRNLGVLMMWALWLFLLVAILTPFFGRSWCTICPLPFFGDAIQRMSFFNPVKGKTNHYNNKFRGLFLTWPAWLKNDWLRLGVFMLLATFSTTLVAKPFISGITVLMLLLLPTLMSFIWELRAFCRYVCPVSVFVAPFTRAGMLVLGNKSQEVCDRCKTHNCLHGSQKGWACPYGVNVKELKDSQDCGLCLECTRSCPYGNVTLYRRPFASEKGTRTLSEAWLTLSVFSLAIVYSVLYEGQWPVVRDYVNILDKKNWDLFGIYALILWTFALVVVPSMVYFLAAAGNRLSGAGISNRQAFLNSAGSLLPLGMMLWIAFVIPMLFVNVTFIIQSISDPFGWGWDFFGTANIPWHQFIPQYIPWLQALLLLSGAYFSLRNLKITGQGMQVRSGHLFKMVFPMSIFILAVVVSMLFFFTN